MDKQEEQERKELAEKARQWAQVGTELKKKARNLGLEFKIYTTFDSPKIRAKVFEEKKIEY